MSFGLDFSWNLKATLNATSFDTFRATLDVILYVDLKQNFIVAYKFMLAMDPTIIKQSLLREV